MSPQTNKPFDSNPAQNKSGPPANLPTSNPGDSNNPAEPSSPLSSSSPSKLPSTSSDDTSLDSLLSDSSKKKSESKDETGTSSDSLSKSPSKGTDDLDSALEQELSSLDVDSGTNRGPMLRIIFIVVAVLLFIALVFGIFYTYNRFFKKEKVEEQPEHIEETIVNNPEEDVDGDGLTNKQESDHGTNYQMPDTDGDGLNDGDEINKYKTDPNNKDTDSDGFSDGEEVAHGFNPVGEGTL